VRPAPDFGYLFIDFNSYFASVEQQENPALRGKPLIITPADTETTCAIAASYEAKAFGIRTGTKVYEARRLCPDLIIKSARHEVYVAYHHRLIQEIERHAPIAKVCSIDEAYCHLLREERTPEKVMALAQRIKAGIGTHIGACLTSSIGIAATPLLAKIASDMQKPNGLVLLKRADMPHRLASWRLRDIPGIGVNMERRLFAARITTIEQLWNLDPRHARALWKGVGGERFWYALHGYDIPDVPTKKSVIGHSRVLAADQRDASTARLVGRALLLKAAVRLRRSGYVSAGLSFSASSVERIRIENTHLFSPTQDSFTLLKAYDVMWQDVMRTLPAYTRLRKMSVVLHRLSKVQERQADLFADVFIQKRDKGVARNCAVPSQRNTRSIIPSVLNKHKEQLWAAVDQLEARYGRHIVTLASQKALRLDYLGGKIAFNRIPDTVDVEGY
jgi:DNA polymerase IV